MKKTSTTPAAYPCRPGHGRPVATLAVVTGTDVDAGTGGNPGPGRRRLVVKVTAGADSPERCSQAFSVAGAAVAAGASVSLWLTGEAAWLALPGRAESFDLPYSAPLADLRDALLEAGTLTLCTQCAARRGIVAADLLPGVRMAGAATFVEEALEAGAQALVY